MLDKKEFLMLRHLISNCDAKTQRSIAEELGMSLGSVNAMVGRLLGRGWIDSGYEVTAKGREVMEPYKIKNAVIMAAGLSSRFTPLSFEKPKGLTVVKGEVLIERQIRQLEEVGIRKIYVVVGYMKELFFYLEDLYPEVKIIVNPEFATRNNNGSLYAARQYLDNTYICSSDNYFERTPFETYAYASYYPVQYMRGKSAERGAVVASDGRITKTFPDAENCLYLTGHAYWNREFSHAFVDKLEQIYEEEGTKPLLWERIFDRFLPELPPLYAKRYPGTIWEFDSLDDLKKYDPYFLENIDSQILSNITAALHCDTETLHDFEVMKAGQTNNTLTFFAGERKYVYRHGSPFTRKIVDREREGAVQQIAKDLGLDDTCVELDTRNGWKISRFEKSRGLDFEKEVELCAAMKLLHVLHDSGAVCRWQMDFVKETEKIYSLLEEMNAVDKEYPHPLFPAIRRLDELVKHDGWKTCLCHNDINSGNFLVKGAEIPASAEYRLIDWEYAGMGDAGYDIVKPIVRTGAKGKRIDEIISCYYGRPCTEKEKRHVLACGAIGEFYWFAWAIYLEANGRNLGNNVYTYYRNAKEYGKLALALYGEDERRLE